MIFLIFGFPVTPLEFQNVSIFAQHGALSPFPNAWPRVDAQSLNHHLINPLCIHLVWVELQVCIGEPSQINWTQRVFKFFFFFLSIRGKISFKKSLLEVSKNVGYNSWKLNFDVKERARLRVDPTWDQNRGGRRMRLSLNDVTRVPDLTPVPSFSVAWASFLLLSSQPFPFLCVSLAPSSSVIFLFVFGLSKCEL